jgi:predicted nucleotidyltransferase
VFGSVARGQDSPDSDLDLLVDFVPGTSLLTVIGLELDLRENASGSCGLCERVLIEARPL